MVGPEELSSCGLNLRSVYYIIKGSLNSCRDSSSNRSCPALTDRGSLMVLCNNLLRS